MCEYLGFTATGRLRTFISFHLERRNDQRHSIPRKRAYIPHILKSMLAAAHVSKNACGTYLAYTVRAATESLCGYGEVVCKGT